MKFLSALFLLLIAGCSPPQTEFHEPQEAPGEKVTVRRVDFSSLEPSFRFSAEIPLLWDVEFVPEVTAINIYDPGSSASSTLEKSQIFIRQFEASTFLTLKTVDISEREETTVHDHAAVRYKIEKKLGVPPFPHQPSWRSSRHRLIDIREEESSPSLFYVFAYNPAMPDSVFSTFIESLVFDNDREFSAPISQSSIRVTKKPFGILITPETSPIKPERFSGYHTGVDFEILEGEESIDVEVFAICDGEVVFRDWVEGYGGVLVEACRFDEEPVTVLYGHLNIYSITSSLGSTIQRGDRIGVLGQGLTEETPAPELRSVRGTADGERKHLHLGVHLGETVEFRGYVEKVEELKNWIDPLTLVQ